MSRTEFAPQPTADETNLAMLKDARDADLASAVRREQASAAPPCGLSRGSVFASCAPQFRLRAQLRRGFFLSTFDDEKQGN